MNMLKFLVPVWRRLALNSLVTGEYEKAEKYFSRIHRSLPHEAGFEYNMGLIRLAQEEYREAEILFKKDSELYGESYTRMRVLGDLYYIWGKRESAAAMYKKALDECESGVEKNILKIRIQKCTSEKAFARVQKSHIFYREGNNHLQNGEVDEALEAFSRAVEEDGTHFQALNNKGSILMNHLHQYTEALACFEQAFKISSLPSIQSNIIKAREALEKS